MPIRWKKIIPPLAIAAAIAGIPYIYQAVNPDAFSGIACVRRYDDGRVEKDMGESCYDPNLPEAIVLRRGE